MSEEIDLLHGGVDEGLPSVDGLKIVDEDVFLLGPASEAVLVALRSLGNKEL